MIQRTTHGPLNPRLESVDAMRHDLSLREKVVVAPMIGLIVLFGFYPKPLTDVITPAVEATIADLDAATTEAQP
jgi:NADH-quinone oxidoreductase subunit M